jgi:hypothetical protein
MNSRQGTSFVVIALILASTPTFEATAQKTRELPAGFSAVPIPTGLTQETADLAIRGRISGSGTVFLDLNTIMALPRITFTTVDPWDGKIHEFTGVLLADVMAWLGIDVGATSLMLTANNKYSIPIKRVDYEHHRYIIAYMIDGKDFSADPSTRRRGPLAIAIDFSASRQLDQEIYKHQLVWQLSEILVQ